MKTIKLLFFILPLVSYSQIPNCVAIRGDYLWMSTTEVSNTNYREFLSNLSELDSIKNLPSSSVWANSKSTKPMEKYYFRHPAYRNYPVVTITYQQATTYCNWLTTSLNDEFPKQKVLVRLPTEKEWEDAARGNNPFAIYPWGTETMRVEKGKNKGKMQANFIRGAGDLIGKDGNLNDGATITAPIDSYWPNDFGLYCMSGNVSEMVLEQGLVKGGSWRNRADWLRIDKQQFSYSASAEVGFRYVVEVLNYAEGEKKSQSELLNKKFLKNYFAKVNDTLSVAKFEVSNEIYSLFQEEMKKNPLVYSIPLADSCWSSLFPYGHIWANNYSSNDKFKNYPVVNLLPWQAEQFCSWFSKKYTEIMGESITIRLPKNNEWEMAARCGLESSPYPWGGPFVRDGKGNFLANHNPKMSESENVYGYDTLSLANFLESHFTDLHDFDGEAVLAPVDSYFPNDFGIYNLSGNAAEMIVDSSFTKGGSWKSSSYYLQITTKEEWNRKADPFTGFRVVRIKKD